MGLVPQMSQRRLLSGLPAACREAVSRLRAGLMFKQQQQRASSESTAAYYLISILCACMAEFGVHEQGIDTYACTCNGLEMRHTAA